MNLRDAFRHQSDACASLGSAFNGQLLRVIAERIEPGTPLTERLFNWEGDVSATGHSVPLRLAGALHGIVLDGRSPELSSVYPPSTDVSDDTLWKAVKTALSTHSERIDHWLDSPPQTNEVARSSVLIAIGHWLTAQTGCKLAVSELGASAGLNLNWDQYALDVGGWTFGSPNPALVLSPKWQGALPPVAEPEIVERRGVDLAPIDPTNAEARLRLLAYIWPDQPERLARVKAALSLPPAPVDRGGAAEWIGARLKEPFNDGICHMIFSTVAWQYFPSSVAAKAKAAIETAGEQASTANPIAWFGMEADEGSPGAALTLRLWPGDLTYRFGRADFHGRWVNWHVQKVK